MSYTCIPGCGVDGTRPEEPRCWQVMLIRPTMPSLFEVSRIKSLCEPMIDRCQEVMGFLAFALLLPESSETGSCSEFAGLGLLILSYRYGLMEAGFRFSLIV